MTWWDSIMKVINTPLDYAGDVVMGVPGVEWVVDGCDSQRCAIGVDSGTPSACIGGRRKQANQWSRESDLNRRPADYESDAGPNSRR